MNEQYIKRIGEIEQTLYQAMNTLDVMYVANLDDESIDQAVIWNVIKVVRNLVNEGQEDLDKLRMLMSDEDEVAGKVREIMTRPEGDAA